MIHHSLPQVTAAPVRMVDRLDGLSVIRNPDCAAAFWQRANGPSFQDWLDTLEPERLPTGCMVLHPKAVRQVVLQICDSVGTPDCRERAALVDDVAALAECFANLMSVPWLRVRLDVATTDACRRVRVDPSSARLFCTYRGPATQWRVAAENVGPRCLFTVPTAAPIVLRGMRWAGGAELVRSSTPLEGVRDTRFVLSLDPVLDLEDAL